MGVSFLFRPQKIFTYKYAKYIFCPYFALLPSYFLSEKGDVSEKGDALAFLLFKIGPVGWATVSPIIHRAIRVVEWRMSLTENGPERTPFVHGPEGLP